MVRGFLSRLAGVAAVSLFAATGLANVPPATPMITEPQVGRIVNASDVHMETGPFSDADAGQTHLCTDWEIWQVTPLQRVWVTSCIGGIERVHTHLADGVFENALAGQHELRPSTNYRLRVRHRDSSGDAATEWSAWAERDFVTGAPTVVFPLLIDDVKDVPPPAWTDGTGTPVVLPVGASLELQASDGDLFLGISGLDGTSNQVNNPAAHADHHSVRVVLSTGGAGTLALPETLLSFTDGGGAAQQVYLPAVSLSGGAGQAVYYWVSASGATYVGSEGDSSPVFSMLARGAAVPYTVLQSGYKVEVMASGFQLPVNIAFVPNPGPNANSPIYYVTELYGQIKVVTRDGTVRDYATGLLNFNPTGNFPGSGEQGVAGIAVDAATGDVYASLLYSSVPGVEAANHYPKIVRFTSTDGGLTAAAQTIILNMTGETMGQSHQVSNVSFGPDGKLYVHVGDGFDASKGQDLTSYRGKILRMNLNGTAPSDNPFYDASNGITARDYVYAYGFRNPFGGAWRAADGLHYEVENGPSVDRFCQVVRARNYLYNGSDASMANFAIYNWNPAVGPVNLAWVQPSTFGGSGFPASAQGHMYISESGPTWGTGPQTLGKRISEFVLDAAGARLSGPTPLIEYNGAGKGSVVALAAGPDGLYFSDLYKDADYTSPIDRGANILRVRFVGAADFTASVIIGAAPLSVTFTDTSTAPSPTSRLWDFGDGTSSTATNPTHVYTEDGRYTVRLTVSGAAGIAVQQKTDYIKVGAPPKIAMIAVNPPNSSDNAVAAYLRGKGFTVDVYNEAPASRPSAVQLGAAYQGVMVSSSITSASVAGEFRTVNVPLIFWENALLRSGRESLTDNGIVTAGTNVTIVDTTHAITQGLTAGSMPVYTTSANLSLGLGTVGTGTRVLARREGSSDIALMAAEAGVTVAGGYVTPARRAFVFLEDNTWASTTTQGKNLFDRSVFWAMNVTAPAVTQQTGDQTVCAGSPVTMSVTVSGTGPFSYQWRRNGQAVAGATRRTYTIASAAAANAGSYDCVVSGIAGTTTSDPAALAVGCQCGPADIGRQGGLPGFDGVLDNNDFVVFVDLFFAADPRADFGSQGGVAGSDGLFNNNDFVVFVDRFFAGC
jgi:PKD repeat protein/glucose/arabinose dehydrogenase